MTDLTLCEVAIAQIEERAKPFDAETKSRLRFLGKCIANGGPSGVASSYGYWLTKEKCPRWAAILQETHDKGAKLSDEEFDQIVRMPLADVMRKIFPPSILEVKFPHLVPSRTK